MQNSLQHHIANGMRQDATYKLVNGLLDMISGAARKVRLDLILRNIKQQYTNITDSCQFH